jgi:hypothetical protein
MSHKSPDANNPPAGWWERVCEAGANFLGETVPRWGDARYLWDRIDPTQVDDPGHIGWRGNLVAAIVCFVPVSVGGLILAGLAHLGGLALRAW